MSKGLQNANRPTFDYLVRFCTRSKNYNDLVLDGNLAVLFLMAVLNWLGILHDVKDDNLSSHRLKPAVAMSLLKDVKAGHLLNFDQ